MKPCCLPLLLICWLVSPHLFAAEVEMHIQVEQIAAQWPRPALAVPELAAAFRWDAAGEPAAGALAAAPLLYATGSHRPEAAPDARAWVGHRAGKLHLLIEFDWAGDGEPKAKATERDGAIWQDDGVEIFLAPAEDPAHPVQLTFNWQAVQGDTAYEYDPAYERVVKADAAWNPDWEVKIAKAAGAYRAAVTIDLKTIVGVNGVKGELLRFDLVRNRIGGSPPALHWSAIEGGKNLRPDYFDFLLLTAAAAEPLPLADLQVKDLTSVVIPERRRVAPVLRGQTARVKFLDPLHALVTPSPAAALDCRVVGADGTVAGQAQVAAAAGVLALAVKAGEGAGEFRLQLAGAGARAVSRAAALQWRDWLWIAADDPDAFALDGRWSVRSYPRTIERQIRSIARGGQLRYTFEARSVALCLPLAFVLPGPQVGTSLMQRWRWKLDDGAWQTLVVAAATQETILANDLPAGPHTVSLEPVDGDGWLAGFRIGAAPLTRLHGFIHSYGYNELLTDVRADLWQNGRVVRSEYVRSPHNGSFEILGLAAGEYRLRLTAAGWQPSEQTVTVPAAPGAAVDLGLWTLSREKRLQAGRWQTQPRYGQSLCATPGGKIAAVVPTRGGVPQKALLVSRYKTIELAEVRFEPLPLGRHNALVRLQATVPAGTPADMYDLRLSFAERGQTWDDDCAQAVCVRPALPPAFFLAGCGHMNTWGQETAEYLQRVGAVAQLAGARELLVANEVNPAYVSGALGALRIPYLACAGNHTMGRWEDFFGGQPTATVDGPLRLASFGQYPNESWGEVERLLTTTALTPPATARVVVCFEGYAPIEMIRRAQVNLLFDGHSDDEHPDEKQFPAGTLHLRAPGQDTLRLAPMTPAGVAVKTEADCPVLAIPRNQPSPLRVEYSAANDGTQGSMAVTVINDSAIDFAAMQVRVVLGRGVYTVPDATVVQQFNSDDGKITVVDLAVRVAAKSRREVNVTAE